jgi:protein-S-isoprenylcysteine O-methyltransferase Ste14
MQASLFEFRYRWWIIACIFALTFLSYGVDHVNSGSAIADWLSSIRGHAATDNSYRAVFALGAILLVLTASLRTWGTAYLRADVMRDSLVHTERLLADGPYRHVRNPLYLGNIVMAIGIGPMASRLGFAILVIGMTVFVIRLLLREEGELALQQGESYRKYCATVPRLIPSLTPRVPSSGEKADWGPALRAESMYWIMALAMAAFAITLNIKIFWAIFAVAMAASFFLKTPEKETSAAAGSKESN